MEDRNRHKSLSNCYSKSFITTLKNRHTGKRNGRIYLPTNSPILSLFFCFIVVIAVAYLCVIALWLGDDQHYMFSFATQEPIRSIGDIFISLNEHYLTTNGRYLAHFLVQLFLGLLGRNWFVVCNCIIYLLFILLLLRYVNISFRQWTGVAFVAISTVVGFQTKFVPSCQIGFLWMFLLAMTVVNVFFNHRNISYRWLPLLIPFAFIAGNGQEALNVGLCGALIIYVAQNWRKLSFIQWCVYISFGLGTLCIICSPGSQHRLDGQEQQSLLSVLPNMLFVMISQLRLTFLTILVLSIGIIKKRFTLREIYLENAFEIHVFIISLLMNFYIHIYCNRQMFGMELMALIILLRMLNRIGSQQLWISLVTAWLLVFILIVSSSHRVITNRKHDLNAVLAAYEKSSDGKIFYDLTSDADVASFNSEPCDHIGYLHVITWLNAWLHLGEGNSEKNLHIFPTNLNTRSSYPMYCLDCNGCVYVYIPHGATEIPVVKRSVTLFGLRKPHHECAIGPETTIYKDGHGSVRYLNKSPLINNDSVVFVPTL